MGFRLGLELGIPHRDGLPEEPVGAVATALAGEAPPSLLRLRRARTRARARARAPRGAGPSTRDGVQGAGGIARLGIGEG